MGSRTPPYHQVGLLPAGSCRAPVDATLRNVLHGHVCVRGGCALGPGAGSFPRNLGAKGSLLQRDFETED